jgi:hypothetical protein
MYYHAVILRYWLYNGSSPCFSDVKHVSLRLKAVPKAFGTALPAYETASCGTWNIRIGGETRKRMVDRNVRPQFELPERLLWELFHF